jgi:hypothetical protein
VNHLGRWAENAVAVALLLAMLFGVLALIVGLFALIAFAVWNAVATNG